MPANNPPIPHSSLPAVALKVLVVEDDDSTRRAIEQAVAIFGYRCRSARDGLEAWQMHSAEHADVIVADWQMPGMDGIELCKRTRFADHSAAYTYFILMTGFADRDHFLRGMEAGADDYQTKPVDLDELRARLASAGRVVALCRKLAEKNSALRHDSQVSFKAARLDPLTGVANRLAMNEDLKSLWSRVKRYDHRYSIAICDVDRFKTYNDQYGHLCGDETLHRVAQAIKQELREGDGLYRYGGDEFVVLLPEQSLARAARAMTRVRQAVERLALPSTAPLGVVSISTGLVEIDPTRDANIEDALRRADAELYRAKERAHGRIEATTAAPSRG